MDSFEERLIEEVRRYEQLYDCSSKRYKNRQLAANSWKDISKTLGVDMYKCMKGWKNVRDKYVRLRKRLGTGNEDQGDRNFPAFYHHLSWLAPHIKHRELEASHKNGNDLVRSTRTAAKKEQAETADEDNSLPPDLPPSSPPSPADSSQTTSSKESHLAAWQSPLSPPQSPSPSSRPRRQQKRKRKEEEDLVQRQIAHLEETRIHLEQKLLQVNDEYSRFGQTVADMLRRLPEEQRQQAMFDIHKLLFKRL